ncbi:MAG TPA: hypothetical protein VF720_01225, partial [Candidatus Eisenbacteria bacterium]
VPGGANAENAKPDSLGWMGPYSIQGFGRSPDRELAVRIAMKLADQSNYVPNDSPDCPFYPRHGLRYISTTRDTVDVLLSFNCSLIMVVTSDGKEGWGGDFSPVGEDVKGMVTPLLPVVIQPVDKSLSKSGLRR